MDSFSDSCVEGLGEAMSIYMTYPQKFLLCVKELTFSNCGVGEDLRVPWIARGSNQSILKQIGSESSLEGLMLQLKLQYFGHLLQRADSLEKTLMLGKIEGRRRGGQRLRWLDGIISSMDMSLSKPWEILKDREAGCAAIHGVTKSWTRQSSWATTETSDPGRVDTQTQTNPSNGQMGPNHSLFHKLLLTGAVFSWTCGKYIDLGCWPFDKQRAKGRGDCKSRKENIQPVRDRKRSFWVQRFPRESSPEFQLSSGPVSVTSAIGWWT